MRACREATGTTCPFQVTWLDASTRSSIGGGGSVGGTTVVVRCGRLTGMGKDTIGAVTMKMINNTSITSTNGVTLISASGPDVAAARNAMLCLSLERAAPWPTLRRARPVFTALCGARS
ncbi:hypothetical protein D9M71_683000 [compost metagenome]